MREKRAFKFKCFMTIFILASLLTLTHGVFAYSDNIASTSLLITEIYPNTVTKNELDEYVAITNPCAHSVNTGGWSITDNEGKIIFPPLSLAPGETIYVTRNASVFVGQMSIENEVGQIQTEGRFALRNRGDEVILQDKSGREVDVVIYGDSSYKGAGWRDEPLRKPGEGMIYKRKDRDTNQCNDWLLLPFGASYHVPERISFYGFATAFVSPDCSFSVLQREMDNASSSLYVNLYQFESPYLMDVVLDALNRGVNVSLLLEGNPVGGIKDEELYIAKEIKERGGAVRFSEDTFINHAKYAVIDNETAIVMTENWKNTGIPCDNSSGNRGWGIVIKDERVAGYFKEVFFDDFYRGKELLTDIKGLNLSLNTKVMTREIPEGSYAPAFEPLTLYCNFTLTPVLAPDTAMTSILGMINSAEESVFVQQFSTGRFWGDEANPFIAALIEAARRGCEVKVLLDSRDYNLNNWNDNDEAIAWMNEVASRENLELEAKLADLDSLGLSKIHNKGLIVDGEKVLITSLNWNANSIYNREAGVILENEEIASFYEHVFFHDWNVPVKGEREGSEGGAQKMRIVWVALTLIISFAIFWVVKWYKRV